MTRFRLAPASRSIAAVFVVGATLSGCGSPPSTGSGPASSGRPDAVDAAEAAAVPGLTEVLWRCVELIGPDGAPVPTTDAPPTLEVAADGRASGFAGVNRFGSDAAIGDARRGASTPLRFGPVLATRMAGPPERMALERAFTGMLAEVREARTSRRGDGTPELALVGAQGVLARFVPGEVARDASQESSNEVRRAPAAPR